MFGVKWQCGAGANNHNFRFGAVYLVLSSQSFAAAYRPD